MDGSSKFDFKKILNTILKNRNLGREQKKIKKFLARKDLKRNKKYTLKKGIKEIF